jgi:hypothetical protein
MNCPLSAALVRHFALPAGMFAVLVMATAARAETAGRGNCARLGEDYVAVAGSDGCVRIGGHVRVNDISRERLPPAGYAAMGPDGPPHVSGRAAHVRAGAPLGVADIFPR